MVFPEVVTYRSSSSDKDFNSPTNIGSNIAGRLTILPRIGYNKRLNYLCK